MESRNAENGLHFCNLIIKREMPCEFSQVGHDFLNFLRETNNYASYLLYP